MSRTPAVVLAGVLAVASTSACGGSAPAGAVTSASPCQLTSMDAVANPSGWWRTSCGPVSIDAFDGHGRMGDWYAIVDGRANRLDVQRDCLVVEKKLTSRSVYDEPDQPYGIVATDHCGMLRATTAYGVVQVGHRYTLWMDPFDDGILGGVLPERH